MDVSVTFVGTATTVLRLGSFTVLTDPNFLHRGQRVHLGYGMTSKRRTEPAMQPQDLPALDAVVLSHLHDDHFDIAARRRLDHDLPIVTTAHAARTLRSWGFRDARALPEWQTEELVNGSERLRITAVPAQHGPAVVHRLLPPVMGSVLEYHQRGQQRPYRVYVTGDTVYKPQLRHIAERFPELDAVLVHLGGTRVLGFVVTMDAGQGARLLDLLRPEVAVPIHFDDYTVFHTSLAEVSREVAERNIPVDLRLLERGQTTHLASDPP